MAKLFGAKSESAGLQEQVGQQAIAIERLATIQKALVELVKVALVRQLDLNTPANAALKQTLAAAEEGIKAFAPAPPPPQIKPGAPAVKSVEQEEEFVLDEPPRVTLKPAVPTPPLQKPTALVPPPKPVIAPPVPKPAAPAFKPAPVAPAPKPAPKPAAPPPPAKPAANDDDEFDLEAMMGKK